MYILFPKRWLHKGEILNVLHIFEYIQNNKIQWKQDKPFTKQRFELMFKMAFYRYRGEDPINLKEFEKQISGKAPEKKCEMVKLPHGPVINLSLLDKVATILTT